MDILLLPARWRVWLVGLAVALALASAGAQPGSALIQPPGSGLSLASPAEAPGPARFAGRVQVHGVLVAQWAPAEGAPGTLEPMYRLLLAPESARVMPHWQGSPVRQLLITAQGPATLLALTSPALAAAFLRERDAVISAEGLFSLQQVSVGGRCGLDWAEAVVMDADPLRLLRHSGPLDLPVCKAR